MSKLITFFLSAMLAGGLAFAQAKPDAPAAPSMPAAQAAAGNCEAKAVSKDGKPLHGAAKAAFMKKCEREAKPDAPADSQGKKGQQEKMKECNAKAKDKKGDDRKAFMKECLSSK